MSVMSKRKKYGDQFKAEAVELVLLTGRSINEVSSELGLNAGTSQTGQGASAQSHQRRACKFVCVRSGWEGLPEVCLLFWKRCLIWLCRRMRPLISDRPLPIDPGGNTPRIIE